MYRQDVEWHRGWSSDNCCIPESTKMENVLGSAEWKGEDVKDVLNYLNHKDSQIQSALIAID